MRQVIKRYPMASLLVAAFAGAIVVAIVWASVAAIQQEPVGAPSGQPVGPSAMPDPTPSAAETETPGAPEDSDPPVECGADTATEVTSPEELTGALAAAEAGEVISLAPGEYVGNFVATSSGTPESPITLCGSSDSVLDGGNTSKGYVFHLDGAKYWNLLGFTVTNGQKGVMADATVGSTIKGLTVHHTGDEAVHLRNASTDNSILENTISDTGLRKPKFGEGIYIGTAESNWCDITGCEPDPSDRNLIEGNVISGTTSESIDVKEGSSDGVVRNNTFDGSNISGADSWVDIKGNGYLVEGNTGTNSPLDGFQTHEILDGWGTNNTFRRNTAHVNGPGFGYSLTPERGNVVECNNTASAAAEGAMNVTCAN